MERFLNNQNKVWALPNWKRSLQLRRNKEVNVLEAENKVKIAERNGVFFLRFFY
jgi:hypothetical protein